ncbi:hypothetical protein E2C01_095872 [Portunus trituberculatus]|uniref:Uncharacterized protein n=1 Tax=Portunus trituberculatus TaxID=210409 RepID=A0A5B7K1A3_PORTR|nr:hypothetical protein [Portunus trituberculatus]
MKTRKGDENTEEEEKHKRRGVRQGIAWQKREKEKEKKKRRREGQGRGGRRGGGVRNRRSVGNEKRAGLLAGQEGQPLPALNEA